MPKILTDMMMANIPTQVELKNPDSPPLSLNYTMCGSTPGRDQLFLLSCPSGQSEEVWPSSTFSLCFRSLHARVCKDPLISVSCSYCCWGPGLWSLQTGVQVPPISVKPHNMQIDLTAVSRSSAFQAGWVASGGQCSKARPWMFLSLCSGTWSPTAQNHTGNEGKYC